MKNITYRKISHQFECEIYGNLNGVLGANNSFS